jgi:hypothetical protein
MHIARIETSRFLKDRGELYQRSTVIMRAGDTFSASKPGDEESTDIEAQGRQSHYLP